MDGLHRFDRRGGRFVRIRPEAEDPGLPGAPGVLRLYESRAGTLWVAGAEGVLHRLRPNPPDGEHFEHFERFELLEAGEEGELRTLTEDFEGRLWLGTSTGDLLHLDPRTGQRRRIPLAEHGVDFVNHVSHRPDGSLWVGTQDNGLLVFDPDQGLRAQFRHQPEIPGSLSDDRVMRVLTDRTGVHWIATEAGLDKLDPSRTRFSHLRFRADDPNSLAGDWVSFVTEDRQGNLWVGSSGQGINRLEARSGHNIRYRHQEDDPASLWDDDVMAMLEDQDGGLWFGTHTGIGRLDPRSGRFEHPGNGLEITGSLPRGWIYDLAENEPGVLWVAGQGGLHRLDRHRLDRHRFESRQIGHDPEGTESLGADPAYDLEFDRGGNLWIGTNGSGLFRLRAGTPATEGISLDGLERFAPVVGDPDSLSSGRVSVVHEDGTGTLWIGTLGGGLNHAEPRGPSEVRFRHFRKAQGLASDFVVAILEDDDGNLWLGTHGGLSRFDPRSEHFKTYGIEDGLQGRSFLLAAAGRRANGELFFGGTAGLNGFFPDRLTDDPFPPEVAIADFRLFNPHELRTPLYGITGLAESLIDGAGGQVSEPVRENLALIVTSGRRLGHLVNDILDFSKLRHQSLELDRRPLDIRALANVVLALSRPLIGDKELELVQAIPDSLPAVEGDEDRLQQILHNLVGNAIKFTESGRVEVSARQQGDRIVVGVEDTGIGIPSSQQEQIFDAFIQADGTTERHFGGTGLGLAVTRQLVELHGGTLGVDSRPGEGATFFFDLAIADGEVTDRDIADAGFDGSATAASEAPASSPDELAPLPGAVSAATQPLARLLVVDDEPVNRRVLCNQLGTAGYAVDPVASGSEALRRAEQQTYDLVLLDVMMPGLSGYEVCRGLRQSFPIDELPVVFLTAKSQPSDLVVGLAAGANDYLPKPVAKSELLARVKTHLELRTVNRQLAELVVERTSQVSERGRLIAEREQLIEQLETKNAELARFNYTVAHDLKNPLTTIMNFLGLARRDAAEGEVHRLEHDFDRLQNAADELRQVLDELFEFSRVGVKANPPESVSLGDLVQSAQVALAELLTGRGATVEVVTELSRVEGDRPRLEELVLHLLRNAVIHVAEGTTPRIEIGERLDEDRRVFYVRDNGLGLDSSYQERIFDLFERLDPGRVGGSGIGLALARRIAEVHGGQLWVESEGEGHGSTFCWRFA